MKLYNTLTRTKEEFLKSKSSPLKMYVCGPTVYGNAHIGNLRTYINVDILRRFLKFSGYLVDEVINLTDIEDKIIRAAIEQGVEINQITDKYTALFLTDLKCLNIEFPEHMPKATDEIDSMITLVANLLEKGVAYISEDKSVYFSIAKFRDYGKLAKLDFSGLKEGARVDQDEYNKENAQDFVLWKAKKEGEPSWKAPFGEGRPGWHIECSAMSMKYLGETIDIHAGGVDLIFPHHENEIAQSEASTGKKFVDFWFHGEHLMINGQKMSKSLHNIFTLDDVIKKYNVSPMDFRMLCLQAHYREKLNFTDDSIVAAQNALNNLRNFVIRMLTSAGRNDIVEEIVPLIKMTSKNFREALDDDLNTPKAISVLFDFIKEVNKFPTQYFSITEAKLVLEFVYDIDRVLGLDLNKVKAETGNAKVDVLLKDREGARSVKNWKRSDEIRNEINKLGFDVEDTTNGQVLKKL